MQNVVALQLAQNAPNSSWYVILAKVIFLFLIFICAFDTITKIALKSGRPLYVTLER